jgi:protein-L-isoaspartate(D-aspartate) O-methyltransferase
MMMIASLIGWFAGGCNGGEEDAARERDRMVEEQIAARGVRDPSVLDAMRSVPRHEFVPGVPLGMAYGDHPVPIGEGQTISQPYIVALMTELLELKGGERVLEIGTGSGYQAAVLSEIAPDLYTVEIEPALHRDALVRLRDYGLDETRVLLGDGYRGLPERAPFDGIIVTAAPDHIPPVLFEQLRVGGRMVIPVGPTGGVQRLLVIRKGADGERFEREVIPVQFVPFRGEAEERARGSRR